MILDIYKDSFEYSSKKIPNLLLLGVLSFLGFLIIPMVFFYGYNYRVIRESTQSMINGDDIPPEFTDLKGMFIDGLKYFVVAFAYMIIPVLIIMFLPGGSVGLVLFLVAIILLIICALLLWVAIANMAANDGSLASAFAISDLFDIISSIGFGRYILTYIGIMLITFVIIILVTIILLLIFAVLGIATESLYAPGLAAFNSISSFVFTIIFSFIVVPYLSVFQSRCTGLIYNLRS